MTLSMNQNLSQIHQNFPMLSTMLLSTLFTHEMSSYVRHPTMFLFLYRGRLLDVRAMLDSNDTQKYQTLISFTGCHLTIGVYII